MTRPYALLMNSIGLILFGRETVRVKRETRKGLRVRFEKNYYRAISTRFGFPNTEPCAALERPSAVPFR